MNRKEIEEKVDRLTDEKNERFQAENKEKKFVFKCLNVGVCPACGGMVGVEDSIIYDAPVFKCKICKAKFFSMDYS